MGTLIFLYGGVCRFLHCNVSTFFLYNLLEKTLWDYINTTFLRKILPTNFSIPPWHSPASVISALFKWWFSTFFNSFVVIEIFCKTELFSIYAVIFSLCGFGDTYLTLWILILYCNYLFSSPNFPSFGHWELFHIGSYSLLTCPHSFVSFLLFCVTTRYFGNTSYVPWCNPRISHFSKDPWILLLEVDIRK